MVLGLALGTGAWAGGVAPERRGAAMVEGGPARELGYTFDFGTPGQVGVEARFRLPASGVETVAGPLTWAGAARLDRAVSGVTATGATVVAGELPGRWRLQGAPGAAVRLRYVLRQDWTGPRVEADRHRVLVTEDPAQGMAQGMVEWTGENGLLAPVMEGAAMVRVQMAFTGVPAGWSVLTSFGEGPEQVAEVPWSRVENALFAAGAMRVRTLPVLGGPVRLGVVGQWSFSDQELALKVRQVLREERRFWQGGSEGLQEPWYAVVLTPMAGVGGGGTAFTHAFALSLGEKERFGPEAESLLAHEAFHEWNPQALGPVRDTAGMAWFTEGVTTYYADELLRRAGVLDRATYLAHVNRLLRDDRTAAARGVGAVNALDAARAQQRAPYLRGAMVALWLQGEIARQGRARGVTQSLDDVMRGLQAEAGTALTEERVLAAVGRTVDAGTVRRLRAMVEDGAAVPLPSEESLGRCVLFGKQTVWSYDLGFAAEELQTGRPLLTVREGSNAWKAGVRNGDVVTGWSMWQGDPDHEVVLTLRGVDGGAARRLHFWPQGEKVTVPVAEVPTMFHVGCREDRPAGVPDGVGAE